MSPSLLMVDARVRYWEDVRRRPHRPTEDFPEVVMARIKLPVSVSNFADIAEVLSKSAKADGRTAFTRQVGDYMEIYSIEEASK